ncbi:hypothetical protein QZH41_020782, partial [Actinostola sp. cb2023]
IKKEIERRRALGEESRQRKQIISHDYIPKHPQIYQLQILLDELGFDDSFLTPLRTKYLTSITTLLYPHWGGNSLDSHKAFTVQYKTGQDVDLSYHYDNAEVTLNVCLGKEFSGGELYFGDMKQVHV